MKRILKGLTLPCFVLLIFVTAQTSYPTPVQATERAKHLLILKSDTITELNHARSIIEEHHGKIDMVFPPSLMVGNIPQSAINILNSLNLVYHYINDESLVDISLCLAHPATTNVDNSIPTTDSGCHFYNQIVNKNNLLILNLEAENHEDDLIEDLTVPTSENELNNVKTSYLSNIQDKMNSFYEDEYSKWIGRITSEGSSVSSTQNLWQQNFGSTIFTGTNLINENNMTGQAIGAGLFDTSSMLYGDIVLATYFAYGFGGNRNWDNIGHINASYLATAQASYEILKMLPEANLTFILHKAVHPNGSPQISINGSQNWRFKLNDLRNYYNSHWSATVRFLDTHGRPWANVLGPITTIFTNYSTEEKTISHEIMHLFGALDQYYQPEDGDDRVIRRGPTRRSGYLLFVNANSSAKLALHKPSEAGYFPEGRGEGKLDIMTVNAPIASVYTRGAVGLYDSDGDGLEDIIDTSPSTQVSKIEYMSSDPNNIHYHIEGTATDLPLVTEVDGISFNSLTLNTISKVEYRINNSNWEEVEVIADPSKTGQVIFSFNTPALSNGSHELNIRAVNSVNNKQLDYYSKTLFVQNSSLTQNSPLASFRSSSINRIASANQTITFQANTDPLISSYSWQYDTGLSFTNPTTNPLGIFNYSTPGKKTVTLKVSGVNGLTNTQTKIFNIVGENTPPVAQFVSNNPIQFSSNNTFNMALDASNSYDGNDTNLEYRWDIDGGGIFDVPFSTNPIININYSYPRDPIQSEVKKTLPLNFRNYSGAIYNNNIYIVGENKLEVYSLNDFTTPIGSTSVTTPTSLSFDINISIDNNNVYLFNNQIDQLQIIDISTPNNPQIISTKPFVGHVKDLSCLNDYCYYVDIMDSNNVKVMDMSNPNNPSIVETYSGIHGNIISISIKDLVLYSLEGKTINFIDLSSGSTNLSSKSILDYELNFDEEIYSLRRIFSLGNKLLIEIDETNLTTLQTYGWIIDFSDLNEISESALFSIAKVADSVTSASFYENLLFIGIKSNSGAATARVYDVSNLKEIFSNLIVGSNNTNYQSTIISKNNNIYLLGVPSLFKFDIDGATFAQTTLKKTITLQVKDSLGAIGETTNVVWANNYINTPSVINISQSNTSEGKVTLSIGTDPDIDTTWDGILEYRWDFNNDGLWDTEFSEDNTIITIPSIFFNPLGHNASVQLRDRFLATDQSTLFVNYPITIGDVNGDGDINSTDALKILKMVEGILEPDLQRADVNLDGIVNFTDAHIILNYSVNLVNQLPVTTDPNLTFELLGQGEGSGTISSKQLSILESPYCNFNCGPLEVFGKNGLLSKPPKLKIKQAIPDEDSVFVAWMGACADGKKSCKVTVDRAKESVAYFSKPSLTKPDLITTAIRVKPKRDITSGDIVDVQAKIKNIGSVTAPAGYWTSLYIDSQMIASQEITRQLTTNKRSSVKFRDAWVATPGEHSIYVCVDFNFNSGLDDLIDEGDENNNCNHTTIMVDGSQSLTYNIPKFNTNLKLGDSGEDVYNLQTLLFEEISYLGDPTGIYDEATAAAVADFQFDFSEDILEVQGLNEPTGIFDQQTRKRANEILGYEIETVCITDPEPEGLTCGDYYSNEEYYCPSQLYKHRVRDCEEVIAEELPHEITICKSDNAPIGYSCGKAYKDKDYYCQTQTYKHRVKDCVRN